jgi:hypothetical protein
VNETFKDHRKYDTNKNKTNNKKPINISVTLVSESYVILYCEKNVICNSSIKKMFKSKRIISE